MLYRYMGLWVQWMENVFFSHKINIEPGTDFFVLMSPITVLTTFGQNNSHNCSFPGILDSGAIKLKLWV